MRNAQKAPKLVNRSLIESVGGTVGKVDREKRIIHGVKILGSTSPNTHGMEGIRGTKYSESAMDKAIPLYEGRQSFTSHGDKSNPGVERAPVELVGVHRNVRREKDGLYSDFHYRSSHDYLADDAEQMPEALGFSHNAQGSGRVTNGEYLVESINKVRSIDLTTRPATTRGLYESEETMSDVTVKQALTALKAPAKLVKQLFEMDMVDGDSLVPTAPGGEDAKGYKDHLGEAVKAILADDGIDSDAKLAKIKMLVKATEDKAEEPAEKDKEATTDSPTMESLQEQVEYLGMEIAVRDMCDAEGFKPSAVQRKALLLFESTEDRAAFIAEAKAGSKPAPAPAPKTGPRSQSVRTLQESKTDTGIPKEAAGRINWLKSRSN